jgi:hypothetical protein
MTMDIQLCKITVLDMTMVYITIHTDMATDMVTTDMATITDMVTVMDTAMVTVMDTAMDTVMDMGIMFIEMVLIEKSIPPRWKPSLMRRLFSENDVKTIDMEVLVMDMDMVTVTDMVTDTVTDMVMVTDIVITPLTAILV